MAFYDRFVQPAACKLKAIVCAATRVTMHCHDAQQRVTKHEHTVGVKTLAAKLRPDGKRSYYDQRLLVGYCLAFTWCLRLPRAPLGILFPVRRHLLQTLSLEVLRSG